ncbi:MAG: hypothetical protein AABZ94_04645, partial [Candidatus Eisenbacteria bacterium]
CGRGNAVLGDFSAARGDRVQAAEYYFRAFLADWKNPAAKRRLQEYKDALEERNKRQMDKLRDALTLAIDSSGSMAHDGGLERVRAGLDELLARLGDDDTVTVTTFGDRARVVLPETPAGERMRIAAAVAGGPP